jgi:hypothetical protein
VIWDDDVDVDSDDVDAAAPPSTDPLDALPTGPARADRRVITIFGMPGYGKTTLAASLYTAAVARGICATWIDTTGNNVYLARAGRGAGVHCAVARTVDGWAAHVHAALRSARPFNVVLVPEGADLSAFWSLAFAAGHQLLAVDEFDAYATSQTALARDHPLRRVIAQGRHRQLSLLSTVRVPPELHKLARAFSDVSISFRQQDPTYAEQIAREAFHGAERRAAAWLQQLPRWHYLRFDTMGRFSWGIARPPLQTAG